MKKYCLVTDKKKWRYIYDAYNPNGINSSESFSAQYDKILNNALIYERKDKLLNLATIPALITRDPLVKTVLEYVPKLNLQSIILNDDSVFSYDEVNL